MKRLIYVLMIIILGVVSCTETTKENDPGEISARQQAEADEGAIRIAVLPTIDALPLYVAYERGMLGQEGLKISFHRFNAQMDEDTAIIGKTVDGAFTDVIRAERLQKVNGVGLDYFTSTAAQWSLITNKLARLNNLEQFGDKMIASTRYSATDYLTDETFKGVKTQAQYYKVQINDVNVRLHMMLNNEMDGAWFLEPQATKAVNEGNRRLVDGQKSKENLGVLVFRTAWEKKKGNKELLKKLKKVYSLACDSINQRGLEHYAPELKKYCNADTLTIRNLPKIVFTHANYERTKNTVR